MGSPFSGWEEGGGVGGRGRQSSVSRGLKRGKPFVTNIGASSVNCHSLQVSTFIMPTTPILDLFPLLHHCILAYRRGVPFD